MKKNCKKGGGGGGGGNVGHDPCAFTITIFLTLSGTSILKIP